MTLSNRVRTCWFTILMIGATSSPASAHYLWATVDSKSGPDGTVNVYFEGGPGPGDGHYLDPFVNHGKTWLRTVSSSEPLPLEMTDARDENKNRRWLSSELPKAAPRAIESYGKWGVYRYGKTDVLLHYYARHLEVAKREQLSSLARAEHLNLDIVLHADKGTISAKILWKGEPAAKRPVFIRGPKGFKQNATSDEGGVVTFTPGAAGRYTLRTSVEQKDTPGEDNGKPYHMIRHHATMILQLPLK